MLVKAMWAVTKETPETGDLKLYKLTATEHQQKNCQPAKFGDLWCIMRSSTP